MIEFFIVYLSILYSVILVGAVLFFTALALYYVYKLSRLVMNDTWSYVISITIAVFLIIFFFSVGIYFWEEQI